MSSLKSHFSEDGNVYAWGLNYDGQTGIVDDHDHYVPTLISWKEGKILEIGLGYEHLIFISGLFLS